MTVIEHPSAKNGQAALAMSLVWLVVSSGWGMVTAALAEEIPISSGSHSESGPGSSLNAVAGAGTGVKAGARAGAGAVPAAGPGPASGALAGAGGNPGKKYMAEGRARMLRGQYQIAAASLEKLIKECPASAEGHLLLGQSYLKLKNYDKARQHLRLAIRTGAGGPSAQKANLALMSLPRHLIAPKSGPKTRLIASMLGLGRSRGGEAKPTVIDFSATWCQPCKQLSTVIARAKVAYRDKVNFMSVNVDDPGSQTIMDQYDVSPIPTMVFLNPDGEVISYAVGFSGDGSVNDGIKKILPKLN